MDHKLFIALQFFVCVVNHSVGTDSVKYDNYTLFQAVPVNQEQIDFLNILSKDYDVKYWRYPSRLNMSTDFLVPPIHKDAFLRSAVLHNLQLLTLIQDVQTEFDKQTVSQYIRRRTDSFNWFNYFRVEDIYEWTKDLADVHPNTMKVFSIGKTHEGRDIVAARISLGSLQNKSIVILEGGIHAREWISTAFVTYAMHQILNSQSLDDDELRHIGLKYEWYFIPILNPDGYEYSHTNDRLWRKNRRGPGVDLNRNFDIAFGTIGSSFNKIQETYCGDHAFSETETRALADFIRPKRGRLKFYLAFHSYGQLIIFPYAYSTEHLENFGEMKEIGNAAIKKINERYGTVYVSGTAYDTVGYKTSGVSGDWVKKSFGVPYVATFELRDKSHYGFALPTRQILPTCHETMDGIVSVLTLQKRMSGLILNAQERASLNCSLCRTLRTPGNILVANLAISDFFMLAKTPVFIFNSFNLGPALGKTGCVIYGFLGGLTGTTSIATLSAIALDRYWAVVRPLEPLRALTAIRARLLAVGSWIYAFIFSIIPALDFGYGHYVPEGYLTSCSFDYLTEDSGPRLFILVFFCAAWLAPFCTISFCYLSIFRVVAFNRTVTSKHLEHRLSSRHVKEQVKRKAEIKLAFLVIAVIALFFISWTPYAVVALLGINGRKDLITPTSSMIPALFCKTAACINPFIYIITHPMFRKEFKKMFQRDKSTRMNTMKTIGYTEATKMHRPNKEDLSESDVEVVEMKDIPYNNALVSEKTIGKVRSVSSRVAEREDSQRSISMKSFEENVVSPPSWYAKPQFAKKKSFHRRSINSVVSNSDTII